MKAPREHIEANAATTIATAMFTIAVLTASLLTGCTITGKSTGLYEDTIGCSLDTEIEILELDHLQQACYNENSIYYVLENTGSTDVTGMITYLEADYNVNMHIKKILPVGDTTEQRLFFGQQPLKGVKSLTITPIIGAGENQRTCSAGAIKIILTKC